MSQLVSSLSRNSRSFRAVQVIPSIRLAHSKVDVQSSLRNLHRCTGEVEVEQRLKAHKQGGADVNVLSASFVAVTIGFIIAYAYRGLA